MLLLSNLVPALAPTKPVPSSPAPPVSILSQEAELQLLSVVAPKEPLPLPLPVAAFTPGASIAMARAGEDASELDELTAIKVVNDAADLLRGDLQVCGCVSTAIRPEGR